jgi:hypothetical protein
MSHTLHSPIKFVETNCSAFLERLRTILIIALSVCCCVLPVHAQEDVDWVIEKNPINDSGVDAPVIGTRWSLGSRQDGVLFVIHFDSKTDRSHGIWYGEVRTSEKFYVEFIMVHSDDVPRSFKVDNAQAQGPDATAFGGWKEGPATAPIQRMAFGLDRERLNTIASSKTLILKYTPFDNSEAAKLVEFPLANFSDQLAKVDADIKADGGEIYLKTNSELEVVPLNKLPEFMVAPLLSDLDKISERTGQSIETLRELSINEIKALNQAAADAEKEDRLAEIRARHIAIYDQEPEWTDLNLCPKPDLSSCANVGLEAYSDDIWGEFVYGIIEGVVWRPEGSIVRIYAGIEEFDRDPEVVRAKEGAYYYLIRTPSKYIDLRSVDGMLTR